MEKETRMTPVVKSASPPLVSHKTRIVLILGLITASAPFATDMFLSGIPVIAHSFGTDAGHAQLTLSVFFFGLAVGQLFYGPLIDRYGRRKPLLFGVLLFTLASFLEIPTSNLALFLGLRFLQALGGSAGMIIGRAVVLDLFQGHEAARVFSFLMIVLGIGPIVAPVLGGLILSVASWRWILVFLAGFGLLCAVLVYSWVAETLNPEHRQPIKLGAIATIMRSLATQPKFMVPAISGGLSMASMFVFISGSPFVLIDLYGVSPANYSLLFAINAVGMIVFGHLNARLLRHFRITAILNVALIADCCLMGLLLHGAGHVSLPVFLGLLFPALALLPIVSANTTALAMAQSGPSAGNASTIIGVLQFVLAGLSSSLVSVLHDGTALPMAGLLFVCALLALLVQFSGTMQTVYCALRKILLPQ